MRLVNLFGDAFRAAGQGDTNLQRNWGIKKYTTKKKKREEKHARKRKERIEAKARNAISQKARTGTRMRRASCLSRRTRLLRRENKTRQRLLRCADNEGIKPAVLPCLLLIRREKHKAEDGFTRVSSDPSFEKGTTPASVLALDAQA